MSSSETELAPRRCRAKIDQGITAKICGEAKALDFEIRFGEHCVKIQRKRKFVFNMHNLVLTYKPLILQPLCLNTLKYGKVY